MTAEVAILNKAAVALAADSAVTISAGSNQEKIFDSADKLFELSRDNAIAVMINNDMNFMEAPLPVLIKRYRAEAPIFQCVKDAADHFLGYLNQFVADSPARIEEDAMSSYAIGLLTFINDRSQEKWRERVFDPDTTTVRKELVDLGERISERLEEIAAEVHEEQLAVMERLVGTHEVASFVGDDLPILPELQRERLRQIARDKLTMASEELQAAQPRSSCPRCRKVVEDSIELG